MFAEKLPVSLRKYSSTIYFLVVLVLAHFFWKIFVKGDDSDTVVTFLSFNISVPFNIAATNVANAVHWLLQFIGFDIQLFDNNVLRHNNLVGARIVWSCTGIKQAFIFCCIIVFYEGNTKRKLWFLPLSLLLIYLFNILRIAAIIALIKYYPNQFDLFHEYIFKYLFYILLFGMLVFWDERINKVDDSIATAL